MNVIAHGGAGSRPREPASRQAVLDEAVACGTEAEAPLDAVCATVRVLEVDPSFNAGIGSAVQSDGTIRTDAGAMRCPIQSSTRDGATREVGAACGLTGVAHAVSVARAVLSETPHVLLAGERAVEFAATQGVETGVDCWTDATRERWAETDAPDDRAEQLAWLRDRFGAVEGGHDTVGAVACDGERVATATSTGGRWFALAGRAGDVPQVGAGFYAGPAGAAGDAGLIVMGADGEAGEASTSAAMQTARS